MNEPRNGEPVIHVLMRKEDLDPARVANKTLIVVDVLFATTAIVTALDHGVSTVHPARDPDEARALARMPDGSHSAKPPVVSGEYMFQFIDGFAPPTPMALAAHLDGCDTLIYTTTNGTVALRAGAAADRVLVGSLINAGATAGAVVAGEPGTIIILCAGTAGEFNMEDFYGAGCLVDRITERRGGYRLTDAALAARDYFRGSAPGPVLHGSMVGRLMHEWGLEAEVDYAARIDASGTAAQLEADHVRAVG